MLQILLASDMGGLPKAGVFAVRALCSFTPNRLFDGAAVRESGFGGNSWAAR